METMDASIPIVATVGQIKTEDNAAEVEDFGHRVDEMFTKVDMVRSGC